MLMPRDWRVVQAQRDREQEKAGERMIMSLYRPLLSAPFEPAAAPRMSSWMCPCGWAIATDEGQAVIKKIRKLHLRSGHKSVRYFADREGGGEWKIVEPPEGKAIKETPAQEGVSEPRPKAEEKPC
jgi:hypothetical protein